MEEIKLNQKTMEGLETIFYNNQDRLIHKWDCYFSVYERYFRKYRNKPVIILEVGVFHGGSLQMWKNTLAKRPFFMD
jgi:hypothetical protein